ncbi:hypothetical protein HII17_17740 [Thalassotalea sp. M1531]|uniref:Uncharacterized protein n=1 Tax=Thalassotalea algicola TaxID=2716224 RepID=A0A7Y0Q8E5_9GAMM|nr:hypothetical protein [Thalassotalea algicola]NMP33393.1 hypothetical protein [Thalassotalea algicola]
MSQTKIEDLVGALLTAPAKAVIYANREQAVIWKDYLAFVAGLTSRAKAAEKVHIIERYIEMAPKWKVAAELEVGMTSRVASVTKKSLGASIGIGVGLLQSAGQFASETSTSSESVMKIKAKYALSNDTETSLKEYMSSMGIELANESDLTKASQHLSAIIPKELQTPNISPQEGQQ